MPRKSADALLTLPRGGEQPKLDPLDNMNERQAAVWRAVVACLPADYFSSAQTRQLADYCSAVCVREDIERELEYELAKKRPRFGGVRVGPEGRYYREYDRPAYRAYGYDRGYRGGCRTVTIERDDGSVRRIRRCD